MKNKKRGSLTAEATIVLPVVIFVIMVIIRMCIVHYQNIVVSAEAMRVASRSAVYWQEINQSDPPVFRDTDTAEGWITDNSFVEHNPYQSLVDAVVSGVEDTAEHFTDVKTAREVNAEKYAIKVMNRMPNLTGDNLDMPQVRRKTGLLGQHNYITVTVTRSNENPLGYLYDKLELISPDEYKVTAKAVQTDATEFMRNLSLIYDIMQGDL